jgi:1-deoxyxylulose-5-phosphate synthase
MCLTFSVIPWSPIAKGLLAKPVGASSLRSDTDGYLKFFSEQMRESEKEIINRVEALAKKRGVSMAQIATAWLLSKDGTLCTKSSSSIG